MKEHGPWKIKASQQIYRDPYIDVTRDDVIRPDGNDGTHVKVWMKPGVSVLPIDADDCVYLTKEFHYAIGRDSIEVVSGGIEPEESADLTAQRELREELGISAKHWQPVGSVDPFTTIIESPTLLYIATELAFGETQLEGTELIECIKLPLEAAAELVMAGEITHGPSCVLILKAMIANRNPVDF